MLLLPCFELVAILIRASFIGAYSLDFDERLLFLWIGSYSGMKAANRSAHLRLTVSLKIIDIL